MNEEILTGVVALLALGAFAQLLAWHAKVPSILVLLVLGLLVGPVFGLLEPSELLGDVTFPLVSLGAAVVLFEGGLTARLQDLKGIQGPVSRLVSIGIVVTFLLTAGASHFIVGLSPSLSFLLGAILVVTGPTVIGPILRHARPSGSVSGILKYEGIVNDPIGAIIALITFQVIQVEQVEHAFSLILWGVLKAAVFSAAIGFAWSFGYLYARRKRWIPEALHNAVLLPWALIAYALANHLQAESGLLAVTVMGMALASQRKVDLESNVAFAEHLRTMLISVLFILLTARITWDDLAALPLGSFALVAFLILIVRPLAVFLSTWRTSLDGKERIFLAGMAPRGIVAAAVSSVFSLRLVAAGHEGAELLMPITFLVIGSCVVVYGLGARPLAKVLGLSQPQAGGVLFLGANRISRGLAQALADAKIPTTVVDTDRRKVMRCRSMNLHAEYGKLSDQHVLNRLDLGKLGQLIALTSSDDANTIATEQFRSVFGVDNVHQVCCESNERAEVGMNTPVRNLGGTRFSPNADYDELLDWARRGTAKITRMTDAFDYDALLAHYNGRALPLLLIDAQGAARVLSEDGPLPQSGERVVSFILPQPEHEAAPVSEHHQLAAGH